MSPVCSVRQASCQIQVRGVRDKDRWHRNPRPQPRTTAVHPRVIILTGWRTVQSYAFWWLRTYRRHCKCACDFCSWGWLLFSFPATTRFCSKFSVAVERWVEVGVLLENRVENHRCMGCVRVEWGNDVRGMVWKKESGRNVRPRQTKTLGREPYLVSSDENSDMVNCRYCLWLSRALILH